MSCLVTDPNHIRLAIIGMVDGNGHPYSWSAIINGGYDAKEIFDSGYGGIVDYLSAQPDTALGIPGATVTHVCCDKREDANRVVRAAQVAQAVDKPEDVIGQVDAVIVATDIGHEHVHRARPFIEAGLPVFIDKPMVDNQEDLKQFIKWQREGKAILSTSAMRYAREFVSLQSRMTELGEARLIVGTMMKSWERYGIHILEAIYQLLEPGGWQWLTNTGDEQANTVHLHHRAGVDVVLSVVKDMYGGYGSVSAYGTKGQIQAKINDTFYAFKTQLEVFIQYLRSGELPFAFEQTIEQMKIIIAGIRSREEDGKKIELKDIKI